MKAVNKFVISLVILSILLSGFNTNVSAETSPEGPELGDGMPGWPVPSKPIPFTEVGQASKAGSYSTTVQTQEPVLDRQTGQPTGQITVEDVTLTGVDALGADFPNAGPLAGNYNLLNWDSILLGWTNGTNVSLNTYKSSASAVPPALETLSAIPNSAKNLTIASGLGVHYDMTAADLNTDGQTEQIVAYADAGQISLEIGAMPGSPGRATSAPVVSMRTGGGMDVFVRGSDDALWHNYHDGNGWGIWNNAAGGTLLSAPAIATTGNGTWNAFTIGPDNCTYQRSFNGSWGAAGWTRVEASATDCVPIDFWLGPAPELPAPTAVARNGGIDLFRIGPDNTLRWNRSSNGTTWSGWQNLGGMLASAPTAVSSGASDIKVFARGADGALWFKIYAGSWGAWKRAELTDVTEGVTFSYAPSVSYDLKVYLLGSDQQIWSAQCSSNGCGYWSASGVPADLNDPLVSGVVLGKSAAPYLARAQSGKLKYSSNGNTWAELSNMADLVPWKKYTTGANYAPLSRYNGYSSSSVRIETGHFLGNGRPQLVMGYFHENEANRVTINVYQTGGGFAPTQLSSYTIPYNVDWFDIAIGDFLPNDDGKYDGVQEIAFAYFDGGTTYGVDILKVSENTLQSAGMSKTEQIPPNPNILGHEGFTGTLQVVSGNFDGADADEIAMLWVGYQYNNFYCVAAYHIRAHLRAFYVDDNNTLISVNLGDSDERLNQQNADLSSNTTPEQIGFSLAAGDTDGDGYDEIVRTWPNDWGQTTDTCDGRLDLPRAQNLTRKLDVLNKNGDDWTFNPTTTRTVGTTTTSVRDRLAIGDLNRDRKNEIVWLNSYRDTNYGLITQTYSGSSYRAFAADLTTNGHVSVSTLAVGNFTREGIRVGAPTYRVQERVDTPVAFINMPPQHLDLVKDNRGKYQRIEIGTGSYAQYATQTSAQSSQTITTQRAYSLAAGGEVKACVGADGVIASVNACLSASIKDTYGENFENTTDKIKSVTFTQTVQATSDDKLAYFGTPYKIWEYPVFTNNSDKAVSSIAVAFPNVVDTRAPDDWTGGYNSNICDETLFYPHHQPYNVWSYDRIGAPIFPDYDGSYVMASTVVDNTWGGVKFDGSNGTTTSKGIDHKLEYSAGAEITGNFNFGATFSGEVRASLNGDYTNTALATDTLTTSASTEYSYFFPEQPPDSKYDVRVYNYWAKGGYQVINFQAEPRNGIGWALYNKPDPAFILPWYGFPDPDAPKNPPCVDSEKQLYSPDIVIEKEVSPGVWAQVYSAQPGDAVRLTATVRNFSKVNTSNVAVRFYLGYPGASNQIGAGSISSLDRENGPQKITVDWAVTGAGEQKIYAVLDPDNTLAEVHDTGDLIDNNIGYGLLNIGVSSTYTDMGDAQQQPYDAISSQMPTGSGPTVTFYAPRASQSATTRFELKDYGVDIPVAGRVFQLVAYQGTDHRDWNKALDSFDLTPRSNQPAYMLALDYAATGYSDNLNLWRWNGSNAWESAICSGYQAIAFPADDLLIVPVCQTGTFAFSASTPASLLLTVTPSAGSGGSISPNSPQRVVYGATTSFTVTPNTGYSITSVTGCGGSLIDNTYTTGAITANCSVAASFAMPYTVTFDSQGGSAVASQSVYHGGLVTEPTAPTRAGYAFSGWYTASTGGTLWNFASNTVTANLTLYAQWQNNPPEAFNKTAPANGATGQSLSPTLEWTAHEDATGYEYCYSSASGPCTRWNSVGTDMSVTLNGLAPNYTYYWQVRAVTAEGTIEADTATWWSFTTTAAPICTWPAYTPPVTPTFNDVPMTVGHWSWVERLANSTVTAGCGNGNFCPLTEVNRAQMAIFLLRSKHCGNTYTPPAVGDTTGFGDVPLTASYAAWVKQLAAEGITAGCGNGNFCPQTIVNRAQMAIFLLRAKHGATYSPPAVGASTGFGDVSLDASFAPWVKQLAAEGVTSGCGNGNFCPLTNVNRAQMATFLVRAFGLP